MSIGSALFLDRLDHEKKEYELGLMNKKLCLSKKDSARLLSKIAIAVAMLFVVTQTGFAQERGVITGVVTDSLTAEPIFGVNVFIASLNKGNASDFDGKYTIQNVPAGTYSVRFSYLGYLEKTVNVEVVGGETLQLDVILTPDLILGEEVVVLAQAAGQVAAIKQQLNSNTIVNVVSKERLSELPDNNAAESVGRLPGVSVQRNAGEASKVVVRGLSPKFNSITVNGIKIPGSDPTDRSVDLSLIPPEVLDGIEVFKALTPDKDADAVGGTVNLLVKKAPSGLQGSASVETGYNDFSGEFGQYKGSLNLSNRFLEDKLGVMVTGSIQRANRSSALLDAVWYESESIDSLLVIENLNLTDTREIRERYGASISMDYSLDKSAFYFSSFMGRTDRDELRIRKRYRVGNTRVEYDLRDRELFEILYTNSLRAEHEVQDFEIDWQLAHSYSLGKTPYSNYARFQELGAFTSGLVDTDPTLIPDFARNDLGATWFQYGTFNTSRSTNRDLTAELNVAYNFELSDLLFGSIKTGGKYKNKQRNYDTNENRTDYNVISEIGQSNPDLFELYNDTHIAISNFIDPDFSGPDFGNSVYDLTPGLDADLINDFYSTYSSSYEKNRTTDLNDYEAGEEVSAAYLMAELNIGPRITFIPGFRIEHTHNFYEGNFGHLTGNLGQTGEIIDTTGGQSYTEFLPQIHFKLNITEGIDLRLAYTETLSRPDYFNLVPYQNINEPEQTISEGNPNLKHTTAANYDAFISFYKSSLGYFSVGAFYKELENIDYVRTTRLTDGEFANFDLTSPINSEYTSTVKGVEFDLQTDFRFLPAPLNGFIVSANVAFIRSETFFPYFKIGPRSPEPPFTPTIVDTVRSGKLPGQPDVTGALTIGYEIGLFSARLSLSHQDIILNEVASTSIEDRITDGFNFWDFRLNQSFKSIEGLTFFVNINNVTSETERAIVGSGLTNSKLSQEYIYGLNASTGLRYTF